MAKLRNGGMHEPFAPAAPPGTCDNTVRRLREPADPEEGAYETSTGNQ
jgi:hypothetical protein